MMSDEMTKLKAEVANLSEELREWQQSNLKWFLEAKKAHAEAAKLEKIVQFYADPATYFAIGFLPDPPTGEFIEDFDETELGWKPGKRAREALGP